jgi:hypothetical protein
MWIEWSPYVKTWLNFYDLNLLTSVDKVILGLGLFKEALEIYGSYGVELKGDSL